MVERSRISVGAVIAIVDVVVMTDVIIVIVIVVLIVLSPVVAAVVIVVVIVWFAVIVDVIVVVAVVLVVVVIFVGTQLDDICLAGAIREMCEARDSGFLQFDGRNQICNMIDLLCTR